MSEPPSALSAADLFGEPLAATAAPPAAAPAGKRGKGVAPAEVSPACRALAAALPRSLRLGTSSWSYPGWQGLVYGAEYSQSKLARQGLAAYGTHPLLRCVSIDRSFYAPLTLADYLRYAAQVSDDFRFIVKAPSLVTDVSVRGNRGAPSMPNPRFLDAELACREFIEPCLAGLGVKAGALVFQFSPLTDELLADPTAFGERLSNFLAALPPLPESVCYAVEVRDAILLTPRFVKTLRAHRTRYCVGLHARMPAPLRQAAALALMDGDSPGPLVVRWSLHGGLKYNQAEARYEPYDRLVDEDESTREALAELAARYTLAGQPVLIGISNNAEGSAPLTCAKLAQAIVAALANLAEPQAGSDETAA